MLRANWLAVSLVVRLSAAAALVSPDSIYADPVFVDAMQTNPVVADPVRVVIDGIEGEILQNVRSYLSIARAESAHNLLPGRIRSLHAQAEDEIRGALEPFGYYRPKISGTLTRTEGVWTASYVVDPGPPTIVRSADVRVEGPGSDDPLIRAAAAGFPLAPGDRLLHPAYERGKQSLQSVAIERGYLDAGYAAHRIEIDADEGSAQVRLLLETGSRYEFGDVEFQQHAFSASFLRRFVPFSRGQPFTTAALLETQRGLVDSNYFDRVEVVSLRDSANGLQVPVRIRLEPRPDQRWEFGAGYGTDTGPRGTVRYLINRVNRRGHRLVGELRGSFISRRLTGRYSIPVGTRGADEFSLAAGYRSEFFEDNRSRIVRGGASWNRARGGWRQTLSLDAQREFFEVAGVSGSSTLILPGLSLSRTRADHPIYPTRGWRLLLDLQGTGRQIGSSVSFLQGRAEAKAVVSPYARGRILSRVAGGATGTNEFTRLPTSIRFFAGGDRSVRGYAFQSLGPTGAEGSPTGGRYLFTGSLEYEHRFLEQWGVAGFVDAGSVFVELAEARLETGAGLGLRWVSPIGLVRLDLASAVSRPGTPLRLHVVIGPDL